LSMDVARKSWKRSAVGASNLSDLEMTLGYLTAAGNDAEQSVVYADSSADAFHRVTKRVRFADILYNAGRFDDAMALFREAESMQAEITFPFLYGLAGFSYCELLLGDAERAGWRVTMSCGQDSFLFEALDLRAQIAGCLVVEERAKKMFEWRRPNDPLLDFALDHLTLGSAVFYGALLRASMAVAGHEAIASTVLQGSISQHILKAVERFRSAGRATHIPRGLLARSWLRFLQNDTEGSRADLDEAWQIAERGPMRLHMADIFLYRARLFHAVKPYPWESPHVDLVAARKLIEQCGYWRRKEELEDAEAAAQNW